MRDRIVTTVLTNNHDPHHPVSIILRGHPVHPQGECARCTKSSGEGSLPFDYATILANVPSQSGDYAIYNRTSWIYVGESRDIRARVLEHLEGDNACITRNAQAGFQYELMAGQSHRVARRNQLILALKPVCNQKLAKRQSIRPPMIEKIRSRPETGGGFEVARGSHGP